MLLQAIRASRGFVSTIRNRLSALGTILPLAAGVTNPLRFALLLALAAGCARGTTTIPRPVTQTFPGFDTGIYPGDEAMRAWARPNSPYYWVGYYLAAPCHRDASWAGKREALSAMGWGLAVLYVGQQTWEGVPERAAVPDTSRPAADTLRAAAQRSIPAARNRCCGTFPAWRSQFLPRHAT
jgi:hypothetical protein